MILPLDKTRKDSEFLPFSPKFLRDHIASNHILLKMDELSNDFFSNPFALDSKN